MSLSLLEKIKNATEKGEGLVSWLAETIRSNNHLRKLLLLNTAVAIVFYPDFFVKIYGFFAGPDAKLGDSYPVIYGIVVGLIFIIAVADEYRRQSRKPEIIFDPEKQNAVKGLRPFGFNDGEIFSRLQRGGMLKECINAFSDPEFRLGVLVAESGCGKTSFLQAGICPALTASKELPLPVYVKLTEGDPLLSIRKALVDAAGLPADTKPEDDLLDWLQAVIAKQKRPLVLLLDQFEQFYIHRPRREARQPFVDALTRWYNEGKDLPAKCLFSVREDYMGRMVELQKALGYTLGVQDIFQMEKFTPQQATAIFQVIAESADLSFDYDFVEELTLEELADRRSGLISPVDIQILSWVIDIQRDVVDGSEKAGFNRSVYRRLGGIEGLLNRFLERSLAAWSLGKDEENVLKVLLSLVDQEENVRAGVLGEEAIYRKLEGSIPREEIVEILAWLVSSKVRLVSKVESSLVPGYELAHERLIGPLRSRFREQLPGAERVNDLLESRVNQWMESEDDYRYYFNRKELRQIKEHNNFVVWGKQKAQKETLIHKSRLYQRVRGIAMTIWTVAIATLAWWGIQYQADMNTYWDALSKTAHVLVERNYYARDLYDNGIGFTNSFISHRDSSSLTDPILLPIDSSVIYDVASCLYWPRAPSSESMNYEDALDYVEQLNNKSVGGYNNWRLPSWEEAMSLMQRDTTETGMHIDTLFKELPGQIWTGSEITKRHTWRLDFRNGRLEGVSPDNICQVWAVRTSAALQPFQGQEFAVKKMLVENNYYDSRYNPGSTGIDRRKYPYEMKSDNVVYDPQTNLFWQRGGFGPVRIHFVDQYIDSLNSGNGFGGLKNWRLPTLEEAMSLMTPKKNENGLKIDKIFGSRPSWICTSSQVRASRGWFVYFSQGDCNTFPFGSNIYVRAVSSGQSSQ